MKGLFHAFSYEALCGDGFSRQVVPSTGLRVLLQPKAIYLHVPLQASHRVKGILSPRHLLSLLSLILSHNSEILPLIRVISLKSGRGTDKASNINVGQFLTVLCDYQYISTFHI